MSAVTDVPYQRRLVSIKATVEVDGVRSFSYGSGVLIGGQQVLTAAHVVWNATAISIHRLVAEATWSADVSSMLIGDVSSFDMAILDVDSAEDLDDLKLAVVNRDVDGDVVISDCWAVGFPNFQNYRDDGQAVTARESVQVRGTISPLSSLRAHTLSLEVTATPAAQSGAASEWSGRRRTHPGAVKSRKYYSPL